MITKDLGMVTAYAYAVAGGYTGTEEEFEQLMADLSIVVDDFDNFSVTITTLPAGSSATASYSDGALSLGIPKGDTGETGPRGIRGETGPQGPKGDKGDTGEVSEEEAFMLTNWSDQLSASVGYGQAESLYIYANINDIVTITSDTKSNSVFVSLYDETNTVIIQSMNTLNSAIIRFRATQKVLHVRVYSEYSQTINVTVKKEPNDLKITNYYDKSAKVSGYIQDGTIYSGYYHSDFIPCAIGETFVFPAYKSTFGAPRLYFYDSEKNYVGSTYGISEVREDGLYQYTLTLTKAKQSLTSAGRYGIHYVCFNMSVSGSDTAVFYRNNVPNTNNPFGKYQPNENEFFNSDQKDFITSSGSSPISGKKIAYNGDSICESRLSAGNTYNGGAYAKMIADITGGTYENRGKGGGTLASGTSASRQVVEDVTNMASDADLICFEGGINDYWLSVPLGDYVESDYSSTLDTTTICGALESIFRQAKEKWVGKPICFIIVHKIKSTVYVANSQGYTFAQAREKMIGICEKYAIPYYDAFAKSGLNAYDNIQNTNFLTSNSSGTADGCHPNALGYEKYYVPQLIELFNSIMPRS